MKERELLETLKGLVEGQFTPDDWLNWWEQYETEVKHLLSPGQFLRLKPRVASHGEVAVLERCFEEAISVLKNSNTPFTQSSELLRAFEVDHNRRKSDIEFGGSVIEIIENELSGSCPDDFTTRLYDEYVKSDASDPDDWIRNRLKDSFLCVGKRPVWLEDPDWPFANGEPMIFISQFELKYDEDSTASRQLLTCNETLYVFGFRIPDEDGFRVEYRIISQWA